MVEKTNKEWKLGEVSLDEGKETQVRLLIAKLPTHTALHMQVHVFRSKEPGPTLLLTAGIHGDEINGIETLRRLVRSNRLMPERGAVIAIPLVNVYGFIHGRRELPDGKDLNRSFPGSTSGSLASRLARILMDKVLPLIDVGVDFHTGGDRRTNFPQIRCNFQEEVSMDLAKGFNPPFILHSKPIPRSFRKEAQRLGKAIIVYEGGESMRLDEQAIREGMLGTQKLMAHLGMKPFDYELRESILLARRSWIRARIAGIFTPLVGYGQRVEKGQVIAHLSDPNGKIEKPIKAGFSSYVVGLNHQPVVHAGDALINLARD